MKELTVAFNNLLQDKRVRAEQSKYEAIQRQRAAAINKYKRAYQEFLDLEAGLHSAKNWYSDMKETVENLEKNVESFVNNRRSEGAQLLNEIEKERESKKAAQAEMERERLRGLMERMSVEQHSSSTPPPPKQSSRPVPAPLFQSGSAPRYAQVNTQGHYQVPSSPPPGQTSYQSLNQNSQSYKPQPVQVNTYRQQSTYNPSAMGRIPGPTSPPPAQTSFGINAMRPGPASPPPTQTSFSTYGNPQTSSIYAHPQAFQISSPQQQQQQQQQQQPYQQQAQQPGQQPTSSGSFSVPVGFVPPPPPPGPPPLGPQQSIHFENTNYRQYSSHRGSQPPPAASSADPWAGLNSWK